MTSTATKVASSFSYEDIKKAVTGYNMPCIRQVTRLYSAAGPVASAVYAGEGTGKVYAESKMLRDGVLVPTVLLSSFAAGANRMEMAMLQAISDGLIKVPNLTVDYTSCFPQLGKISALEHTARLYDVFLQSTLVKGVPFAKSDIALRLAQAGVRNHTPIYEIGPCMLSHGWWDARRPGGGKDARSARVIFSEIIGVNVSPFLRSKSRLGPISIGNGIQVYEADPKQNTPHEWTVFEDRAVKNEKGEALGCKNAENKRDARPSVIGASDVAPGVETGLYDMEYALHSTVLSLPGLRRMYFPLDGDKDPKHAQAVNVAGRAVVAALALTAETLVRAQGYDLRSHCVLYISPDHPTYWEIPSQESGTPDIRFKLSVPDACDLLATAVKEAKKLGLKWHDGDGLPELPVLTPDDEQIRLLTKHYQSVEGLTEESEPEKKSKTSKKNDK